MARFDRYRIGIPRELSEIRTQPWLSEGSLTYDPYKKYWSLAYCVFQKVATNHFIDTEICILIIKTCI